MASSAQRVLPVGLLGLWFGRFGGGSGCDVAHLERSSVLLLAPGHLLLHSKSEVFPTPCKGRMLLRVYLDKPANRGEQSPLQAGVSAWLYSSFLSLISVTTEIPAECEMILWWVGMCPSYSLAGLRSRFLSCSTLSDFRRGSAASTAAAESPDKIFSWGNPQEDVKLPS